MWSLAFVMLLSLVARADAFHLSNFQSTTATTTAETRTSRKLVLSMSTSSSTSAEDSKSITSSTNNNFPSRPNFRDDSSSLSMQRRKPRQINKDVVIVGGGLAGLSTALYLSQIDPQRHITILERNSVSDAGNMASLAAAGMLAPHSERLPKGDYLDLCMASRKMFSEFVAMVESLAQEAGPEGAEHLRESNDPTPQDNSNTSKDGSNSSLEPWNVGYVASGGFLAPAFAGDNVATWAPPESEDKKASAIWLDETQVRELEPHLHPDVVGGWWFPEDASVDAQRLTRSLKAACVGLGVEFLCGSHYEVTSLDLEDGECLGLWLKSGKYIATKSLLVANGAWMRNLLPVPLEPHKGQSLSLRMPKDRPPILRRVLFAQDSYIVPKADGRIVVGATVEAGSFDSNVTPAGIMHILSHAMQLVPGLAELPLEDTWAGLRPTTPDKGPILGETPWKNLYLAGGNWRNGVLLAPKTGQLLGSLIASQRQQHEVAEAFGCLSEKDSHFLKAFSWDRFTSPEGAKRLAANSRYAASMYPVHTRRSGVGVAAAVGTELGSYSTARSAGEERRRDRKMLFGSSAFSDGSVSHGTADKDSDSDEALERAAEMGRQDAAAFSGLKARTETPTELLPFGSEGSASYNTIPYDGSADAFTVGTADVANRDVVDPDRTVGSSRNKESSDSDLQSIYQSIANNKSKQKVDLPDKAKDERPYPGFRIYHLDKETGQQSEVPPYTTPGDFLESLKRSKHTEALSKAESEPISKEDNINGLMEKMEQQKYDETTYDGYQAILEANGSSNREDELKAMREARRKNRLGHGE